MKFRLTFLVCVFGFLVQAQSFDSTQVFQNKLKIPDSIEILVLGEEHHMDNSEHKLALIKELYYSHNTRRVIIEMPRIYEYLVREYVLNNDQWAYNLLLKAKSMNEEDRMRLLEGIRAFNSSLSKEEMVEVNCFDIDDEVGENALVNIDVVLSRWDDSKLKLLKSLTHKKTSNLDSLSSNLNKIELELESNKEVYQQVFKEYYTTIIEAVSAVSIANYNGKISMKNDTLLLEREKFISKSIRSITEKDSSNLTLVFAGQLHATNLIYDSIFDSYSFTSMLRANYGINTMSCYTIYYNRKIPLFQRCQDQYEDDLNFDLKSKFEKHDYLFIEKDGLEDSPFLQERCDAILVKNCYGKKR
ncbi:MAG: hypothetical protein ACJASQ_002971 [Crocinitomicaceae bacterium]|jgi:hypothetical protein